jgi:ABC-type uncharacterized transport system substrate-binding protein
MKRILVTLFLLVAALAPARVGAHPHVWVDAMVELRFDGERLTHVTLDWTFDPFFSLILFDEFDFDGDRRFDAEEVVAIREAAFNGLGAVGFFTDLRVDGEIRRWDMPEAFAVSIGEEDMVTYRFTLALDVPVAVLERDVTLSLYDPEFYVYVGFNEERPITMIGADGLDCGHELEEALDTPLYFNTYHPIRAVLACEPVSG